eukprot:15480578-Alexandrium_andersonii.AAC.1
MAGLGLSSPHAMLAYLVSRADSAALAALQPSGQADLRPGCQVPPCVLAPLILGWQEPLCEAVQFVAEAGAWDDPPAVLSHGPVGQHAALA